MGTNQWDPDSATSNRSVFFRSAQPVWKKGESTALHSRVVFLARLDYAKDASLTITGCNFYRVFLNGEFVGYGPARTSHGYAEVDSYPLNLSASRQNVLEIYALAYGSDNYYAPNEPAFLQAEVVATAPFYLRRERISCFGNGMKKSKRSFVIAFKGVSQKGMTLLEIPQNGRNRKSWKEESSFPGW